MAGSDSYTVRVKTIVALPVPAHRVRRVLIMRKSAYSKD